ncbi:caveolae-associated protein 2-like [Lissotriton helveticus]
MRLTAGRGFHCAPYSSSPPAHSGTEVNPTNQGLGGAGKPWAWTEPAGVGLFSGLQQSGVFTRLQDKSDSSQKPASARTVSTMAEAAIPDSWRSLNPGPRYSFDSPELVAPGLGPEEPRSQGAGPEGAAEGAQVNALTVLTLLEKLASMLDSVQQKQQRMAQWQTGMENSVKRVQGHVSRLSKEHTSTSNMVSKLMDRSLHLSADMKEARQHALVRSVQVSGLEQRHELLLNRSPFKVLLFQEQEEIPANIFLKEPEPPSEISEEKGETSDEKTKPEEIWHTVDLSSDEELARAEEGRDDDSVDEKTGESRAKKIRRSGLKKVDSLKKAFTRQNIEKTMNRLVPPEKREKIKKSLSPSLRKKSMSGSESKGEDPTTTNEKSIPEEEVAAPQEGKPEEPAPASDPGKTSLSEEPTSPAVELAETAPSNETGTPEPGKETVRITLDNSWIAIGHDEKDEQAPEEEIRLDSE